MPFEDVTSIYIEQRVEDAADAAKLTDCLAALSLAPVQVCETRAGGDQWWIINLAGWEEAAAA